MFKYQVIAQDIESKIRSGYYKTQEKLPREEDLCRQYDTSRITVRQAMEQLVNRGLIARRQGVGTFVKAAVGEEGWGVGYVATGQQGVSGKDQAGKSTVPRVHEFMLIPASAEIGERLQVQEGEVVCYICRTRLADDRPHGVEYIYMPTDFITGITMDVIQGSLCSYAQNVLKQKIQSVHRTVRASMPTEEERVWLDIHDAPVPIFEMEQIAYLGDGRIFEYSKSRYRADCFEMRSVSTEQQVM